MGKRYRARSIKKHHAYTIEEAADAIGAHPQTIRGWAQNGLTFLNSQTPHLLLGDHLLGFLAKQAAARKRQLGPDEIYCFRCRAGKIPAGRMADFFTDGSGRGRLEGICPDCEGLIHRFVRDARLGANAPNLEIRHQLREPRLKEPTTAPAGTHFRLQSSRGQKAGYSSTRRGGG